MPACRAVKDAYQGGGYSLMHYCPFCGGSTPRSRRDQLFHKITTAEQHRLCNLTKDIRTVQQVTAAFGEPDTYHQVGRITTTRERENGPEITKSQPVMIYRKLSDIADVHVTVYPADRVAIHFQGKGLQSLPS